MSLFEIVRLLSLPRLLRLLKYAAVLLILEGIGEPAIIDVHQPDIPLDRVA